MRVTELAHQAVRAVVRPGDTVIDATVGNGHDTLFLARCVGANGLVAGFDVQDAALQATRERLEKCGVDGARVRLNCESHEKMASVVEEPVAAVMFNLGYLPGGDHARTTVRGSTIVALGQAWASLRRGGVISVVCYRGHPRGGEEAAAVCAWAEGLEGAEVEISEREETESGPFLVVVRKR